MAAPGRRRGAILLLACLIVLAVLTLAAGIVVRQKPVTGPVK